MTSRKVIETLVAAEKAEKSGDFRSAVTAAQKALVLSNDQPDVRRYLARLLMADDRPADAYAHYRTLWTAGDLYVQSKLVESLQPQTDRADDPELETDILQCLDFPNADVNKLIRVCCARVNHKHPYDAAAPTPDLDALGADPFLIRVLSSIICADTTLERLLVAVRRGLLVEVIDKGTVLTERIDLIVAMALQSAATEYALFGDEIEAKMVESLLQLQEALMAQGDTDGLLGTVLVAAMYLPLDDMPAAPDLRTIPVENWPESVRPLVKRTLLDRQVEREIGAVLPSLEPIRDDVSRSVQAQYEENPYPRWLTVGYREPVDFHADLQTVLPGIDLPEGLERKSLNILVAGGGTGRQPISIAKAFEGSKVMSVDLSRASLAYGKRMADEMGVDTVDFCHGDILSLPVLDRKFPVIFCSGVLHHMDDPVAGWRVLCDMMEPGGVMSIALYSERARQAVVKAKLAVSKLGLASDADSIRRFRHDILSGLYGDRLDTLTRLNDFFSVSGTRDLVFHVQEHRYTPLQIDGIRRDLGLEFLGFPALPALVTDGYRKSFPDDPTMTNLSNWDRFEEKNPGVFLGMFNMWFRFAR